MGVYNPTITRVGEDVEGLCVEISTFISLPDTKDVAHHAAYRSEMPFARDRLPNVGASDLGVTAAHEVRGN